MSNVVENKSSMRRVIFRNITVFSIIAAIITVVLLVTALAVPPARSLTTSIVTIEVGLLIILIYALISAHAYLTRVSDRMNGAKNMTMRVDRCPDFYTASRDSSGEVVCANGVERPDLGSAFRYTSTKNRPIPQTVPLKLVDGKRRNKVCAIGDPGTMGNKYYNIPWTHLRPRCTSGVVDAPSMDGRASKCDDLSDVVVGSKDE